ncbi:MAG: DNA cytosine methyltransferase [Anaerolineales bacterium]|nr:DNA cytosine methyltransferase [Anaerolineales bacterium]
MENTIPIIDIFAGPGGLGEGFSSFVKDEKPLFGIKLSIEKDEIAHKTLELRAFYRQFTAKDIPLDYYKYLKGNIGRKELYKKYSEQASKAKREAWLMELGKDNRGKIRSKIKNVLEGVDNWVLIGGPPCQAYSLIGRTKLRNQSQWKYARDHRHTLYKEYLQILADHQPPVFVMENVKGLLSSRKGRSAKKSTFDLIVADLKQPLDVKRNGTNDLLSYKLFSISSEHPENSEEVKPESFIVRSEDYGIPQARHRIIILGIRSDIYEANPTNPEILTKIKKQIPIESVIGDLPKLRSGLSKDKDTAEKWRKAIREIENTKWLKSISLKMQTAIVRALKSVNASFGRGKLFAPFIASPKEYRNWYVDDKLGGVCNHETRAHIREDLHRYFFASVFARMNGKSPKLSDFPSELLPKHENIQKEVDSTIFNDRFRVQVGGRPSTTVVSHISKDGHYYIHYDPSQCRSLTVREAARLQTFPDNYFFEGNRTQQYHQVGNAVPPLLANKIAEIVYNVLEGSK